MTVPVLELKGVSKRFGAVQALTDVDFDVDAGEVVALVGDNGAGKSTLVKTIVGHRAGRRGRVRFDGRAAHDHEPAGRDRPRDRDRLPGPRARATTSTSSPTCSSATRRSPPGPAAVSRQLDEIGDGAASGRAALQRSRSTIPSLRSEVGTLSGGQRQQVAVARSLLGEPEGGAARRADRRARRRPDPQVLDLIRRLRERGLGVVVISHNLVDVFEVADRIVVLRLGRNAGDFDGRRRPREDGRLARSPALAGDGRREAAERRRARRRAPSRMSADRAATARCRGRAAAAVAGATARAARRSRATSARCGS